MIFIHVQSKHKEKENPTDDFVIDGYPGFQIADLRTIVKDCLRYLLYKLLLQSKSATQPQFNSFTGAQNKKIISLFSVSLLIPMVIQLLMY